MFNQMYQYIRIITHNYLVIKVDFDEFTKATAVVVSHSLGVAERFQQGVGCRRNYECQSMLWP